MTTSRSGLTCAPPEPACEHPGRRDLANVATVANAHGVRASFLILSLALVLGCGPGDAACREELDVGEASVPFVSGSDGYHTFRIPALARLPSGRLVAFAEGRHDSVDDAGEIDIVQRISDDDGASWGPLQVTVAGGGDTAGNPAPVYDADRDQLLLLFNRAPAEAWEGRIRSGEFADARTGWITTSADGGETWSSPVEITAGTKEPTWRWFVFGPGHGIQLRSPAHRGRLVVGADHSTDDGPEDRWLGAHLVYSDDGGDTWQIGGVDQPGTGFINPNETTIAELADGRILANTRDQNGSSPATRAITHSVDGGRRWSCFPAGAPARSSRSPLLLVGDGWSS